MAALVESLVRKRILLKGLVQGIGYRWFVCRQAQTLNLTGWVRNLLDGGVEVEAQGAASPLEKFIQELRTGHSLAQVRDIRTSSLSLDSQERSFEIR